MDRRVVITGIGVVSPIGNDLETFWQSLLAGRSGIRPIQAFDTSDYDCRSAGKWSNSILPEFFKEKKDARRADRYCQLGVAASAMAMRDCGMDVNAIDPTRVGVMLSSGIGGLQTLESAHSQLMLKVPGVSHPSPFP
ncbi:MAG: beta-ketoacyl synthase N-terminal-like domain-containing protein [Verrucomicrobiales bacterium]